MVLAKEFDCVTATAYRGINTFLPHQFRWEVITYSEIVLGKFEMSHSRENGLPGFTGGNKVDVSLYLEKDIYSTSGAMR